MLIGRSLLGVNSLCFFGRHLVVAAVVDLVEQLVLLFVQKLLVGKVFVFELKFASIGSFSRI